MFKLDRRTRGMVFVGLAAFAVFLAGANPQVGEARPLLATSPSLGTAAPFAILAGTPNITDVPTSTVFGNVGLSPATGAGIGLTCTEVSGTIYSVDGTGPLPCRVTNPGLLTTAKSDLTTAYGSAELSAACTTNYGGITKDLATLTLVPGVYCADAFGLSGTLTLSDTLASDVWIFRTAAAAAALTTTPGGAAKVVFKNNVASPCNVWWKVTSSATIGGSTAFIGNILALTSISLGSGASLSGRALAQTGAVTLNSNLVNAAMCSAGAGGIASISVKKSFSPAAIPAGGVSTLTITFFNANSTLATITSFTDNLPSGMVIAGTPATNCGGTGAPTGTLGGTAVSMPANTRTIPASGSCTLSVNVTAPAGSYLNTLPSGALLTNLNDTDGTSSPSASAPLSSVAASAPASQPREVPEGDTLLLFGGGIGGLATWLSWQWRKVRTRSKQ